MANILVLGSAGQIGKPLVRHLEFKGHTVQTFDVQDDLDQDLRVFPNRLLDAAIEDADFVFFLAFDVGGSKYLKTYEQSYEFIRNNMRIMDTTFKYLHAHGTPFVFASSQMSNMSYSVYGQLKAIGESYTNALGGINVKFWNVYGYEDDPEKAHVITDFVRMALERGEIKMMTNGNESRQFLYVEDCVDALECIREAYNDIDRSLDLCVTNFTWNTILDVAHVVSTLTGAKIVPGDSKDTVQLDRRNEPDHYFYKVWYDHTKRLWPRTPLKTGISEIVRLMKENQ